MVNSSVGPLESSLPVKHALHKLPVVHGTVGVLARATTVPLVLRPFSIVHGTAGQLESSLPVQVVLHPFSAVHVTVGPRLRPLPVQLVILPLARVHDVLLHPLHDETLMSLAAGLDRLGYWAKRWSVRLTSVGETERRHVKCTKKKRKDCVTKKTSQRQETGTTSANKKLTHTQTAEASADVKSATRLHDGSRGIGHTMQPGCNFAQNHDRAGRASAQTSFFSVLILRYAIPDRNRTKLTPTTGKTSKMVTVHWHSAANDHLLTECAHCVNALAHF